MHKNKVCHHSVFGMMAHLVYSIFDTVLVSKPTIMTGFATERSVKSFIKSDLFYIFQCSLCSGKACDGHAERGAAHIVEANFVTELDGGGVAAVLAANAKV